MFDLRLSTAIYIFNGLLEKDDLARAERTRLMKLLYLTNIEYLSLVPNHDPVNTPFEQFQYTAFPNGPLEEYVYSYIEVLRSYILNNAESLMEKLADLSNYRERLDQAIAAVRSVFVPMDKDRLVAFTHNELFEWARTDRYQKMSFDAGYMMECNALNSYLSYSNVGR